MCGRSAIGGCLLRCEDPFFACLLQKPPGCVCDKHKVRTHLGADARLACESTGPNRSRNCAVLLLCRVRGVAACAFILKKNGHFIRAVDKKIYKKNNTMGNGPINHLQPVPAHDYFLFRFRFQTLVGAFFFFILILLRLLVLFFFLWLVFENFDWAWLIVYVRRLVSRVHCPHLFISFWCCCTPKAR